jgi:dipeptidyl aminopeptidase
MAQDAEESHPLTADYRTESARTSLETDSTTSIVLENLNGRALKIKSQNGAIYSDKPSGDLAIDEPFDVDDEDPAAAFTRPRGVDRKWRLWFCIICLLCVVGWLLAAVQLVLSGSYKHTSTRPHDPAATKSKGSGKKITLDQVLGGQWRATRHAISWIAGPQGEDGLLLERGGEGPGYLVVDDVRNRDGNRVSSSGQVLMLQPSFFAAGRQVFPSETWPSPDMQTVLVMSERESNWRHSYTGLYWIFDVKTQSAQALDPRNPFRRVQLASWSPRSNAIAFTRDNNLYVRKLDQGGTVTRITKDGGSELFYGVPDWVYEEEVFSGNSATWWSEDGRYVAFLRTNESQVPTFPIQYYLSRPSGKRPRPGEEFYPEVRDIKYPKAGSPNPTVNLQFYDVGKNSVFSVNIDGDFPDPDRLITEVVWAGTDGKILIKETNRVSDMLKVILIDADGRKGQTIREQNVKALDGGWFEVSEDTTFIPADPANGRPNSGYVDTVIHNGYDHLAYFTPVDNPQPIMLTSGNWEVVKAPSAIDLKNNYVYFIATKESSIERHVYRVKLDGTGFEVITDVTNGGYHEVTFSKGGGYALLAYEGPNVPWQKIISMPGNPNNYQKVIEDNKGLQSLAAAYDLPLLTYYNITIDGFELNLLERRPPHFNPKKTYPVLFWMYQGPGSQSVDKKFAVDFQAYVAASLGYIVVTLDGRGTGFRGRKTRCIIRGNIGHWEAHDQIEAAKMWAKKSYVDPNRMAIWGWSYGGFMSLKVLEEDGGNTFKYGMAVAPVTDWRFYGKILALHFMSLTMANKNRFHLHRAIYVHASDEPSRIFQHKHSRCWFSSQECSILSDAWCC